MKQNRAWVATAIIAAAVAITPSVAHAQAAATATQQLQISAFGGGSGTWTDLLGGRNLGITAGADLGFLTFHRFRPVLEVRGTYPFHSGQIDGQKNVLAGLKVERQYGPFHPYANFLIGRGQVDYQRDGLQVGSFIYLYSTSTVFSPGVGVDYDLTDRWSMKADFQYQSWDVPFAIRNGLPTIIGTSTGSIHPRVLTLAAVYRFDFNPHYRHSRRDRTLYDRPAPPPPPAEPLPPPTPEPPAQPPAQPQSDVAPPAQQPQPEAQPQPPLQPQPEAQPSAPETAPPPAQPIPPQTR